LETTSQQSSLRVFCAFTVKNQTVRAQKRKENSLDQRKKSIKGFQIDFYHLYGRPVNPSIWIPLLMYLDEGLELAKKTSSVKGEIAIYRKIR
jgi:hypothetical protein